MTGRDLLRIVDLLDEDDIPVWLDGGWAVDAALGRQTRAHDDLDIVVDLDHVEPLSALLESQGYVLAGGGAHKSFELVDEFGRQVDVHPVVFVPSGDGRYLMETGEYWIYPARGFAGEGRILARVVRCLTPEVQMLCHTGYEPHRQSYDDVWALGERFDLRVPDEYRAPRAAYPLRNA